MSDLISRQAALDAINEICERCGEGKKYNGVMCGACNLDGVADIVEDLPSAQPDTKAQLPGEGTTSDLISRQDAIDAECEVCQIAPKKERGHNCTYYVHGCKEIECLRELPSAHPEIEERKAESAQNVPIEDLISRKAAIDALDCINGTEEVLRSLPSAQPEPCKDAVSRDSVKFLLCKETCHPGAFCPDGFCKEICEKVDALPSATPKQRMWEWIPVSERLPEEDKDVLVTVYFAGLTQKHKTGWNDHIKPSTYVDIASYYGGDWVSASDEYKVARSRHRVIAWMPLSEPYRAERRTDE